MSIQNILHPNDYSLIVDNVTTENGILDNLYVQNIYVDPPYTEVDFYTPINLNLNDITNVGTLTASSITGSVSSPNISVNQINNLDNPEILITAPLDLQLNDILNVGTLSAVQIIGNITDDIIDVNQINNKDNPEILITAPLDLQTHDILNVGTLSAVTIIGDISDDIIDVNQINNKDNPEILITAPIDLNLNNIQNVTDINLKTISAPSTIKFNNNVDLNNKDVTKCDSIEIRLIKQLIPFLDLTIDAHIDMNNNNIENIALLQCTDFTSTNYINLPNNVQYKLTGSSAYKSLTPRIDIFVGSLGEPQYSEIMPMVRGYQMGTLFLKEMFLTYEIPHDYKKGTAISFYVNYAKDNALTTGDIVFNFEYRLTSAPGTGSNEIIPGVANFSSLSQPLNDSSDIYKIKQMETTNLSVTNMDVGSLLYVRLYRDYTLPADTYNNNVWIFNTGIHYNSDNFGTKSKNYPF